MYAIYVYRAGTAVANILSDVTAILTGETNVANLSADCVQASSSILTTATTAGWTLHDTLAGVNAQAIKAPVFDDPSKFKYVVLDTNTAGYIFHKVYETWDAGTHAGTNLCLNSNATFYAQRINTTSGGTFYIFANVRHITMWSYQSASWGSSQNYAPSGVYERTRRNLWDTVANGYPPFAWVSFCTLVNNGSGYASTPRILYSNGLDMTGLGAFIGSYIGSNAATIPAYPAYNPMPLGALKEFKHPFIPLYVFSPDIGFWGGDISEFADLYLTTCNYGGPLDEVIYNGNTYVILTTTGNRRIAVRKG